FLDKRRRQVCITLLVVSAAVLLFGLYSLVTYSIQLQTSGYATAHESYVADKAMVAYDAALQAYEQGDFAIAQVLCTQAYSDLTSSDGKLPASRNALAGDIQFLLGNSLVKQKKVKEAVQAYEQALRHN